jgi:hypothetical protein
MNGMEIVNKPLQEDRLHAPLVSVPKGRFDLDAASRDVDVDTGRMEG